VIFFKPETFSVVISMIHIAALLDHKKLALVTDMTNCVKIEAKTFSQM